jgi:SAM-dependent methyltransferase
MADEERDRRRLALFDQLIALVPAGRCVDLGAGHGKFSARAASAGWTVVAVDARTERFPPLPQVEFVHRDIREFDLGGFDLVLCLGLFYHLTLEDQIDLLDRASGTPLLLDTHLATGDYDDPGALSEIESVDAYEGCWYREGTADDPLASWGNERSFWHTPDSLVRLLEQHGYPVVLAADPWVSPDRRFHVALPDRWVPATSGLRGQLRLALRTSRRRLRDRLP